MKLSPKDFQDKFDKNELHIAFVGMSNIGKSYCAERIGLKFGFSVLEIDHHIQLELGLKTMEEAASWLGYPSSPDYAGKAELYLKHERDLTLKALNTTGNVIIDTTGSIIYTSEHTINALKNNSVIVRIKGTQDDISRLEDLYFEVPKPTIWGPHFHKKKRQKEANALRACYPNLLKSRSLQYDQIADVTLTTEQVRAVDADPVRLLDMIAGK